MPLPDIPDVIVKIPGSETTPGVIDAPPSVEVFPIVSPPDNKGLLYAKHNGSAYPLRSTITTDPTRVVVWIGPVAPAIDSSFALNNVDVWWSTGA
jgi:hypothetical protein